MGVTTSPIILNKTFWTLIATGACAVTFTSTDTIDYVVNNANTQPSIVKGHIAVREKDKSLALLAGEFLFVKGNGTVIVTVS